MAESVSLAALVRGIKRMWPNATVWTKGDRDHQGSSSDHNDDDTPGSKPEQTDADNVAERRAADVPLLGGVTMRDLDGLRIKLTQRNANRARLKYVILRQTIWRRNGGWVAETYRGEYHNHLHASVYVGDDNNGDPWDLGDEIAVAPTVPNVMGDADMRIIIGNMKGRATLWSGLRNSEEWPLTPETDEEALKALEAAGAVRFTFNDAESLVSAMGTMFGTTVTESVAAVQAAG